MKTAKEILLFFSIWTLRAAQRPCGGSQHASAVFAVLVFGNFFSLTAQLGVARHENYYRVAGLFDSEPAGHLFAAARKDAGQSQNAAQLDHHASSFLAKSGVFPCFEAPKFAAVAADNLGQRNQYFSGTRRRPLRAAWSS